jgi:pimeloyl-ACP methyl ester carboxylesterase
MTNDQPAPSYFDTGDGRRLAYRLRPGCGPTLIFLPGYASDMDGAKASALDAFAGRRGIAMLRFDYSGTGLSSGAFEDGTLSGWLEEALAMVDHLTQGPIILVGSSMGGWIALHLAMRRPERVKALVGIAAAPDFTDWGGDPQVTTRAFWESGQGLRLLAAPIAIDCPVRLVHGDADRDVPVAVAIRLMAQLRSADVQLDILKGGGHRLSEPREIEAIVRTVAALLEPAP